MKALVINADDLGMTPGINRAIIEAHRAGMVTSTSLLVNGAAFADAVAALRQCPRLSAGLHVNLTEGRPVAQRANSTLTGRGGDFYPLRELAIRLSVGAVSMDDMEAEIAAQAELATRSAVTLSHFDSHENVHLHPRAARAVANVARRMNVRWIRFKDQRPVLPALLREAGMLGLGDHGRHLLAILGWRRAASGGDGVQPPRWVVGAPQLLRASPRDLFGALVPSLEDGITEWVCHPGYADDELRGLLPAAEAKCREDELRMLTDPGSRARLDAAGIKLVSYADLV
jgi:chitin disaccharide deacetylase